MQIYFSDVFEVDPEILEEYGTFNISLINDLPLFVDPFLLFHSDKDKYQQLHNEIVEYVRFLKNLSGAGAISEGLLRNWFMFREIKQNWLGYSEAGNSGSGLGLDFARSLHRNFHTIFSNFGDEQVTKSSHLEKLCLIKDGVGRDNISDFTTNLIKEFLLQYTQDFAQQHIESGKRRQVPVNRVRFNYTTRSWETDRYELPWYNGDYVILTPKDILTKDETWINKTDLIKDFDDVSESLPNLQLRAQVNEYFLRLLPEKPENKDVREAIGQVLEKFPQLIDFFIRHKEEHGDEAISLSEERVKEVERLFIQQLSAFVTQLSQESNFYTLGTDTYQETRARVLFLKDVIENKGGHKLFFANGEPVLRESDLQILFRLTWFATSSDVSREVNDGRGPVDFKISRGRLDKSLVEFKLAKNTHLKRNLEKQVPIYKRASDAEHSLRVILYFTDEEFERVQRILKELDIGSHPDVILIDARETNKPSGSKA